LPLLLLITDLEIGGTPTVVRELAIRLNRENGAGGNGVTVACLSRWGPVADQLREAGVAVIAFDASGAKDLFATTRRLISLIRSERFDTVFSFLIHANLVAAIASRFCPDVRFLQSIQTTQPTPRWHWKLQSLVHHAAEKIIVPSPSTAQAAMDWADVPAEKIVVIPNAMDSECGCGTGGPPVSSKNENHGRPARATATIGFIGRLDPIKRIPDLLQAVTMLDAGFHLEIFGEGKDRPRIESEIARRHLQSRAILHGAIARPNDALRSIDVLVLPSAAEGFGLVLIEAMAAGVPVVATDVPGIRDVVKDGVTGLLVPVASPIKLAEAIRRVFNDVALRDRLIAAAQIDVQLRFSWAIVLPQYNQVLLRV
jgi:glycosyltransferase involved in cell wall biosynthesis